MDRTLRCIVCGTDVGPGVTACPRCSEPRERLCTCTTFVAIDQRSCPSCSRVLPRVISMETRSRRRWTRRVAIGAASIVVLGGIGAFAWPRVRDARRLADLRSKGEAASRDGRAADAVASLSEYVRVRQSDAEAWGLLAAAHFANGEDAAGTEAAERALRLDAESPGMHLALARSHERAGAPRAALREARQAREPEARAIGARSLGALGRWVEATAEFENALAAAPRDVALLVDAARAHGALGDADWPRAAEHAKRAADLVATALGASGGAAQASHALRLVAAEAAVRAGRAGDAVATLGPPPVGRTPAETWTRRTRVLAAAGATDQARSELDAALARDASDTGAVVALAQMLVDAGRPAEAIARCDAAMRGAATPPVELLEAAGDAAAAAGDAAHADVFYRAWIKLAGDDPRPLRKSLALSIRGAFVARRRGALGANAAVSQTPARLGELGNIDPDDRWYLLWYAQWNDLVNRPDEASRNIERLTALYPQDAEARGLQIRRSFAGAKGPTPESLAAAMSADPNASVSDAHVFAAEALGHGLLHLAIDVAVPALERSPDDAVLVDLLARCLLALGRPAAARAAIDAAPASARAATAALREVADVIATGRTDVDVAAVATDGVEPDRLLGAARLLSVAGRADDAATVFASARKAFANDPEGLRRLAEALEDAGRFGDARATWDAVVAIAQNDVEAITRSAIAGLAAGAKLQALVERKERLMELPEATAEVGALTGLFTAATDAPAAGLADVHRVLDAEPERTALLLAAARIEAETGDFASAARDTRIVLRRRPAAVTARSILMRALADIAAADLEAGRVAAALESLEEVAALRPGAGDRRARSPLADLVPPPLPPEALAHVQRVTGMRPDAAGHRLVAALDEVARGRADDAERIAAGVTTRQATVAGGPLVLALLRGRAGRPDRAADVESGLDAAASLLAPPADVALVRAGAAEAADPGSVRALSVVTTALRTHPTSARLRAASGTPEDLVWLLANDPAEFDALGPHAAAARIAAAVRAPGTESVPLDAATARVALRRALALAPSDPLAPATRAALR